MKKGSKIGRVKNHCGIGLHFQVLREQGGKLLVYGSVFTKTVIRNEPGFRC